LPLAKVHHGRVKFQVVWKLPVASDRNRQDGCRQEVPAIASATRKRIRGTDLRDSGLDVADWSETNRDLPGALGWAPGAVRVNSIRLRSNK
jgi:hypothetical protein